MPSGRPAKPSRLKLLEGDRSKVGRKRLQSTVNGRGAPTPPSWLTAEEMACWKHLVDAMPAGVFRRSDDPLLEQAAVAWAQWRELTRRLTRRDSEGNLLPTIYLVRGTTRDIINPLITLQHQTADLLMKLASQLGFSPTARGRIVDPGSVEPDPLDILLADGPDVGWTIDMPRKTFKRKETRA